jgi:hypothetical protein
MKIVILTNNRKPNYIHRCIRDIRRDYKGIIDLMISGDPKYLDKYTKGFKKHYNTEEGLTKSWNKACQGYANCLRLGKKEGVLIIEDDTGFKKGWYKQFLQYISFVRDKQYIISLGKAMEGSVVNPHTKIPSLQLFLYRVNLKRETGKPPTAFIITWLDSHAVYYPPTLPLEDMALMMEKFGVKSNSMHDILVGYYLFRKLIPIYIASPDIALNIGAHNTSVGVIENMNQDYLDWPYES